jgi:hypothetical protein
VRWIGTEHHGNQNVYGESVMADHFFLRIFMAYHLAWLMYYSFWLLNLQVHLAFFFFLLESYKFSLLLVSLSN